MQSGGCLAFADLVPVDEQTLLLSAAAFGGGMGRLREVCGCLSGCYIILGLLSAGKVPSDQAAKKLLYQRIQAFAGIYKERHGSYICRELLKLGTGASDPNPAERTAEYYKKRPCPQLARDTAEQFARFLESEGIV